MFRNLLTLDDKKIGAAERLLLYRFLDLFGRYGPPPQRLEALLDDLQFPEKRGRKAVRELAEKRLRWLIKTRVPASGRGRPLSSYRPSEQLLEVLDQSGAPAVSHQARIRSVLWKEIRHRAKPSKDTGSAPTTRGMADTLSPEDVWLLGVLLAHADIRGVVSDLSRMRLSKLTALNAEQLKFRFRKLERLEIAFSAIAWARSDFLSGDMNAVIHLNLDNEAFNQPNQLAAEVFVYAGDAKHAGPDRTPAALIETLPFTPFALTRVSQIEEVLREPRADGLASSWAREAEGSDLEEQGDQAALKRAEIREQLMSVVPALGLARGNPAWEKSLAPYFRDFQKQGVLKWFKARVSLYAALMLEVEWSGEHLVGGDGSSSPDFPALALIRRDFSQPRLSRGELDTLHDYIHGLAREYAEKLSRYIHVARGESKELKKILGRDAVFITVTADRSQILGDGYLTAIRFRRANFEESVGGLSRTFLVIGHDRSDLPNIRWLQKPLPTSSGLLAHSQQPACSE